MSDAAQTLAVSYIPGLFAMGVVVIVVVIAVAMKSMRRK